MSKTLTGSYVGTYAFETNGGVGYAYDGQLTNLGTVTGPVTSCYFAAICRC